MQHVLWIVAVVTEVVGVFLLSVEAIKIENLRHLRLQLQKPADFLNPSIVFIDGDEQAPPNSVMLTGTGFIWRGLLSIITLPILAVLWLFGGVFEKIEANTAKGTVGIVGITFWLISFCINKFVLG